MKHQHTAQDAAVPRAVFTDSAADMPHSAPTPIRNRDTEQQHTYFRCERFFTVGHQWYATIREGRDIGPFGSRRQAELAVARYVASHLVDSPAGITELDRLGIGEYTHFVVLVQEIAACLEQRRLRSENSSYVWAKQRLDRPKRHPDEESHPQVRSRVLEYLLTEMDS